MGGARAGAHYPCVHLPAFLATHSQLFHLATVYVGVCACGYPSSSGELGAGFGGVSQPDPYVVVTHHCQRIVLASYILRFTASALAGSRVLIGFEPTRLENI